MAYIRPKGDILVHISAASKILGICKETLRRWESKGMIVPQRDDLGHRVYRKRDLWKMFYRCYGKHKKGQIAIKTETI